jgi:hypothetical protein
MGDDALKLPMGGRLRRCDAFAAPVIRRRDIAINASKSPTLILL